MERAFYELVRRTSDRIDYTIVSAELADDLVDVVRWERIRVPMRPIPLKIVVFALLAGRRLRRVDSDLVHTLGAIVPNRVDLATVQFCSAGYIDATGALAPPGPPTRRLNTSLARLVGLILERWCYRPCRLRLLAPVSEGIRTELDRHYRGIEAMLTPNGASPERFRPDSSVRAQTRAELGVADDTVVALFVGGDWRRKGLDLVIEGLAQAVRTSEVVLWIVGKGDVERYALLADANGVSERVSFLGPRVDTERFYAAADIFVFPSLYEADPLVVYEAAASGLAVIATPVNGAQALVEDGRAGISVPRDAAQIAEALEQLAMDPELRDALGIEARSRVSRRTWSASTDAVLGAYRRLGLPTLTHDEDRE
jgi:glycosyltransferase involved in cell wall biosynthesis